jgi:hypothetical protein
VSSADNQLYLTSSDGQLRLSLYAWSERDPEGMEALAGITGFGLPDAFVRWFEGAGDGGTYQGTRIGTRPISVPFTAEAPDRSGLLEKLSQLAVILDPEYAPARLHFALPGGEIWFVDVVRESGGDVVRSIESDNRTWFNSILGLRAGDPYWTRAEPEQFSVRQDVAGISWLPNMAEMRLATSQAFGAREMENKGDTSAYPIWRLDGPFTQVILNGPKGETLKWDGTISAGQFLVINTFDATVVDQTGANRYTGLDDNPDFWLVPPGVSSVYVQMSNTSATSAIVAEWQPRRWAVI